MKRNHSKKFNITILDVMFFTLFLLHACAWVMLFTH